MEATRHDSQSLGGTVVEQAEFEVERICPTKRPGRVIANCWVRFGPVRVLFKVIRGRDGPFICPPASPYTSSSGRACYSLRVKFLDPFLRDEVQKAVLYALNDRLALDGQHVPGLALSRATADALT